MAGAPCGVTRNFRHRFFLANPQQAPPPEPRARKVPDDAAGSVRRELQEEVHDSLRHSESERDSKDASLQIVTKIQG